MSSPTESSAHSRNLPLVLALCPFTRSDEKGMDDFFSSPRQGEHVLRTKITAIASSIMSPSSFAWCSATSRHETLFAILGGTTNMHKCYMVYDAGIKKGQWRKHQTQYVQQKIFCCGACRALWLWVKWCAIDGWRRLSATISHEMRSGDEDRACKRNIGFFVPKVRFTTRHVQHKLFRSGPSRAIWPWLNIRVRDWCRRLSVTILREMQTGNEDRAPKREKKGSIHDSNCSKWDLWMWGLLIHVTKLNKMQNRYRNKTVCDCKTIRRGDNAWPG
jgi:hypothetical protein